MMRKIKRFFMEITDVRVKLVTKDDSRIKAVASITIEGCFVVHDVKIIEGNDGPFVVMPSKKASDGTHKDIAHPINTETRDYIIAKVLEAYNNTPSET